MQALKCKSAEILNKNEFSTWRFRCIDSYDELIINK